MSYTLGYSGGTITVNDGTLNNSTSLQLPGKNYTGYGSYIEQNFVSMLENFASSSSGPSNAIKGQIWFDIGSNLLKYNTSNTIGTPTWAPVVASGVGMSVSLGDVTLGPTNTLTVRTITSGSSATPGSLIGTWNVPAGSSLTGNITIPIATSSQLGGIKVGSGLTVAPDGTLSAESYALPVATGSVLGGIKVGSGLSITGDGTLSATGGGGGGTVTSVSGTGSVNGITLSGTVTNSGSLTLGGALSGVNLASQVTGTLPIANGGTGQTTAQAALNALLPAQSSSTIGSYLTSDGTNASWNTADSSIDPTNTLSYTTLPGNIRYAWGMVNFGDIYVGHDTQTISLGSTFSELLNVNVQLRRNTPGPGTGAAYPIITTIFSSNQFEVYLQETTSGSGPYDIYWTAIGKAFTAGSPTAVTITPGSWVNNGDGTSSLTMTASATGNPTIVYSWSYVDLDAGVIAWSAIGNSATITMNNYIASCRANIQVTATNSLGSGSTTTQVTNPNFEGGGGGY